MKFKKKLTITENTKLQRKPKKAGKLGSSRENKKKAAISGIIIMKEKIVDRNTLCKMVREWKSAGKRIVSTSGCFDILHPGHVQYLEEAKKRGDILIVMLNADVSVQQLKGKHRPIIPQEGRAIVAAGLAAVDCVCTFTERTPCALIAEIQPDVVDHCL